MAMEYSQKYMVGPEDLAPAPLGLEPKGPDRPGTVPQGIAVVGPGVQTGANITPVPGPTGPRATAQYVQRYPEGYAPGVVPYIGGLRGHMRAIRHYGDPLIEPTFGPIKETNGGYPYTYLRSVVRSYKPSQEYQSVYVNGKAVAAGKFKARPIAEINALSCE